MDSPLSRHKAELRRRVLIALVVSVLLPVTAARAVTPVIDSAAIAKVVQVINSINESIAELKKQVDIQVETVEAIGHAASIHIPKISLESFASDMEANIACIVPTEKELQRLLPTAEEVEIRFDSACRRIAAYQGTLFKNPDVIRRLTSGEQLDQQRLIRERRAELLTDSAIKSMSLADQNLVEINELHKAISEAEKALEESQDMNQRMAAQGRLQVLLLRIKAQEVSLNAQRLRMESARIIHSELGVESKLAPVEEADNG